MTTRRKDRPVVHLTASQHGDVVRLEWSVQKIWTSGDKPSRAKSRLVNVSFAQVLNVPQLTHLLGRLSAYVLRSFRGPLSMPETIAWAEAPGPVGPVPPGSGGRGVEEACPYCGRTEDTDNPEVALPSVVPPSGAGGGGERSDLLSVFDLRPEVLPGQLELPLLDAA